jgi:hypothetical protein
VFYTTCFLGKTACVNLVTKMSFIDKAKKKLGFGDGDKGVDEKVADEAGSSTVDKVKGNRSTLDKIQDFFTMGYSTKEDLRELDKKLRDGYSAEFNGMRHKWEEISLAALKAKQTNKDDYKKVIQVMDRVEAKINRADYGYAGLMDRKGSIKENALGKVFDYDKALGDQIQGLKLSIQEVYSLVEAESWSETAPKVRNVKLSLLDIEQKWDGREKEFRPLEV